MRCLVVIPTYNERENLAPLVAAVLRQGEMFDVLVVDDNSPDGTVTSPIGSLRARRVCGCFTVPGRMGLGTAYVAASGTALPPTTISCSRWTRTSRTTRRICPVPAEDGGRLRRRHRIQEYPWRWRGELAAREAPAQSWRQPVRQRHSGAFRHGCDGRVQMLQEEGPRVDRSRRPPIEQVLVPDRGELSVPAARVSVGEVPIVFTDRVRGGSKMSRKIVVEAVWMVWKLKLEGILGRDVAALAGAELGGR